MCSIGFIFPYKIIVRVIYSGVFKYWKASKALASGHTLQI